MKRGKLAAIITACVAIIVVIVIVIPGEPIATPTPTPTYTLDVSVSPSGAGSVSPSSGEYESGMQVTLTASPASGYIFDHWSGDASGTSPTIVITIDSSKDITAYFEEESHLPEDSREAMIETFKTNALAAWGDDYEMVNYEVDNQIKAYDWCVSQTAYPDIMERSKGEWQDDYEMVKYEYENQVEAYEWIMSQTAYPDIMERARQEWGEDYEMVKYEYENQVEAYEAQ